jgi:hypothetical protein
MNLHNSGIRPAITDYLKKKSEEERDYGDYWSASSAGYCMRLQIMRRLGVPKVPELQEDQDRTTRVFEVGHLFHEWIQRITKDAGLSIASEVELIDDKIMVKGHFDDLILVDDNLILYDYKTAHSGAFKWKQGKPIGDYHRMQLGTYMYMLRKREDRMTGPAYPPVQDVSEARILTISKDDLRMDEKGLEWAPDLEKDVVQYWNTLNGYWKAKKLPRCTCLEMDGGFLGKRTAKGKIYNDYFYNDEPCSLEWLTRMKKEGKIKGYNKENSNDSP